MEQKPIRLPTNPEETGVSPDTLLEDVVRRKSEQMLEYMHSILQTNLSNRTQLECAYLNLGSAQKLDPAIDQEEINEFRLSISNLIAHMDSICGSLIITQDFMREYTGTLINNARTLDSDSVVNQETRKMRTELRTKYEAMGVGNES